MWCLTWREPFSYGGSSGGHGGGGHAAAKPAADGALGGLSPIVLILGGLGLLVLLGLLAAAVSGGLGRSFGDGFSLLPNDYLSSFDMEDATRKQVPNSFKIPAYLPVARKIFDPLDFKSIENARLANEDWRQFLDSDQERSRWLKQLRHRYLV